MSSPLAKKTSNDSPHFSPLFVARKSRRRFSGAYGPENGARVAEYYVKPAGGSTSRQGERIAAAVGEW